MQPFWTGVGAFRVGGRMTDWGSSGGREGVSLVAGVGRVRHLRGRGGRGLVCSVVCVAVEELQCSV